MMRYGQIEDEIAAGTAGVSLPVWARQVLDDVAEGRSDLAAVRHPLGFLCLPVERAGELGVCLHIWSPELRPVATTTSGVHCHSWDLVSFVLYGTLRNVRARLSDTVPNLRPELGGATHRVFEVASRDGVDELRPTGRTVRCTPGDEATFTAGDSYTLPAGVFHSTLIEHGPDAATVALGRQTPGRGDLSLGPLDTTAHQMRRQRSDPDETVRTTRRSAGRVAAAHPLRAGAHPWERGSARR
ncbi:hypothetical protein [Spirillospora sp. CA-294931]|uniref:hypothetical protein n=1 Tax=Spirillospora sp. CA-294931 TaxID=3240042 RepID=UPI003D8B3477